MMFIVESECSWFIVSGGDIIVTNHKGVDDDGSKVSGNQLLLLVNAGFEILDFIRKRELKSENP
jgi:hypothetical protein